MTRTPPSLLLGALVLLLGPWVAALAQATTLDATPKTRNSPEIATPERVNVSPANGTASYAYRFDLPPGTGGLTPELVLTYSTETRNTEYGYGWNLNLGWIERSTRFHQPYYHDPAEAQVPGDEFELEGDLLVRDPSPVPSPGAGVARFHRRYGDASRIEYHGASNHWVVTRPDGTQLHYGTTPESILWRTAETNAETFRWSLTEVVDPRGNAYEIEYLEDVDITSDDTNPLSYNTYVYPRRIRYSLHPNATALQESRLIELDWGPRDLYEGTSDPEPNACNGAEDCPTSYRAGFKVQRRQRLVEVIAGLDANGNGTTDPGEQVRRYELLYFPKPDHEYPEHTPYSQLASIQRYGQATGPSPGGVAFDSETTFTYKPSPRGFLDGPYDWAPGVAGFDLKIEQGMEGAQGWYPEKWVSSTVIDLNGDGLPDRVKVEGGEWKVAYGTPQGFQSSGGQLVWDTWLWDCDGDGSLEATRCEAGGSDWIQHEFREGSDGPHPNPPAGEAPPISSATSI